MPYKDPDRQRAANRAKQARKRARDRAGGDDPHPVENPPESSEFQQNLDGGITVASPPPSSEGERAVTTPLSHPLSPLEGVTPRGDGVTSPPSPPYITRQVINEQVAETARAGGMIERPKLTPRCPSCLHLVTNCQCGTGLTDAQVAANRAEIAVLLAKISGTKPITARELDAAHIPRWRERLNDARYADGELERQDIYGRPNYDEAWIAIRTEYDLATRRNGDRP